MDYPIPISFAELGRPLECLLSHYPGLKVKLTSNCFSFPELLSKYTGLKLQEQRTAQNEEQGRSFILSRDFITLKWQH